MQRAVIEPPDKGRIKTPVLGVGHFTWHSADLSAPWQRKHAAMKHPREAAGLHRGSAEVQLD